MHFWVQLDHYYVQGLESSQASLCSRHAPHATFRRTIYQVSAPVIRARQNRCEPLVDAYEAFRIKVRQHIARIKVVCMTTDKVTTRTSKQLHVMTCGSQAYFVPHV
ncbi:hypothetical protein Plhal304r1_c008g0034241 [Plasmopara halstedii]